MKYLGGKISLAVNDKVYLKDPRSSKLGNKIVEGAIDLIDEIGFEEFTFRKLATAIDSTEASVYRYFENKHKLLVYLTLWYWGWLEYRLVFRLVNIEDPQERLNRAITAITETVEHDSDFMQIDEIKLDKIVITESSKIYMNKLVDSDNSKGFFKPYKDLVQRVCDIILEINPDYKYPHMLVTTCIEGAHHQRFFAEHLPRLTDILPNEDAVSTFYLDLIKKAIKA
jgi:AcrR family transcriptional regulator